MIVTRVKKLSVRARVLATLGAIVAAVALPQACHLIGATSGVGSALGEALLPMHLPILLAGLLAGPLVGTTVGVLAPLLSFALTGMPRAALLPFMLIELGVYGAVAGLLSRKRMPVLLRVLLAQLAGRAVRAAAILVAAYGFSYTAVPVSIIWTSVRVGLFGILLQWILLPLIVYRVKRDDA